MNLPSEVITPNLRLTLLEPTFENASRLLAYVRQNQEHFYFMYGFVDYTTVEEMYDFLMRWKVGHNFYYGFFLKDSQELIGSVSLRGYNEGNGTAEIGYSLDKNFVHKGLMTEALSSFSKEAFAQGARKLIASVDALNISSQKVCERCGFVKEATLIKEKFDRHTKEFVDVFLYYKTYDDKKSL